MSVFLVETCHRSRSEGQHCCMLGNIVSKAMSSPTSKYRESELYSEKLVKGQGQFHMPRYLVPKVFTKVDQQSRSNSGGQFFYSVGKVLTQK